MMKKMVRFLIAALTVSTLFTSSFMLTQDEGVAFIQEVNKLIDAGVSKEEIETYLGDNDLTTCTQMLREAQATGYFTNKKAEATTAPAAPEAPKPTPTPAPKHEHKYSAKLTKDPTCYEEGTLTYTCDCGDTYEEPVAILEHQYSFTVTAEPTCETTGTKEFKCSLCGDTYTETIEAKGHTDGQFKTNKAPTCTEEGMKTIHCGVCAKELRTETIEPTGHRFTETYTTQPGFFKTGMTETRCKECNEVLETEIIPVPTWQYIAAGCAGAAVLIAVTAAVIIIKKRKK